jgi:adenine-specific DNA-methyltransferase
MAKNSNKITVETLTHDEATRKNIPTAEYQSVMAKEVESPIRIAYERRNRDLDPQLVWRGKDEQDWSDLVVHAPPLYIQEKVHPKVLIDDLLRQTTIHKSQATGNQLDLFADFNGLPTESAKTEFYQHDANWSNRMILGDSLQVMASLAEREGLRGKVQCIYLDPPYGIKFNSNFQWSTTSRDVKDGNTDQITREPEQVKAFRDTWRDGIHSYLTYLRDRLTVARDLLTDSGSIFVQIGDENVHRVRAVMDEVFGETNFLSEVIAQKTGGFNSGTLPNTNDYVLWYAKNSSSVKFRASFETVERSATEGNYQWVTDGLGFARGLTAEEKRGEYAIPTATFLYQPTSLTSQGSSSEPKPFVFQGKLYSIPSNQHWKTTDLGLERLSKSDRFHKAMNSLRYVRLADDFPVRLRTNTWTDTATGNFTDEKIYVVQTSTKIVERCIIMSTDPGDLVLDPTGGSGTSAYASEQWGRRWISIDTSRVALALARARIMGARYPYYLLADSPEGQRKEAEVARTAPSRQPTRGDIRQGFVYERVPHITLKSIANNAEIDVIWEKYQQQIEPLLTQLSGLLLKDEGRRVKGEVKAESPEGKDFHSSHFSLHSSSPSLAEWEVPREFPRDWPESANKLHEEFWKARLARQKEIDASIAAKAEFEYLYDKPYEAKKTVRVAGPFTVESLSPHRVLTVGVDDELIDGVAESKAGYGEEWDFTRMILENLKTAGVQQAHKEDKIAFTSLTPWPGDLVCAEGRYIEGTSLEPSTSGRGQGEGGVEKRAAIFIGPEFGTVSRPDLVAAAREAGDGGFDVLITCAFNYDAHSSEFNKLGRIPVLKARMNADLHMADDLKNTGKGNLFVIFGEPDVEVISGLWLVTRDGRMVTHYDSVKELSGLGSLEEINRVGKEDISRITELPARGKVRSHGSSEESSRVGISEHRGGGSEDGNGRISPEPERGEWLAGGSGNTPDSGRMSRTDVTTGNAATVGRGSGDQQNARRTKTIAAVKTLKPSDFPLSVTTSHYSQVTIYGVDVFHPTTGEVRSDGAEGIACWFIDTDYNEESFFVRHAYFLGANDPYKALKTTLKAEINEEAWATLNSDTSRPFDKPTSGRIAVKVINHLGDEVMKVFRV